MDGKIGKIRCSNLELLRIVSMFMIIAYHYVVHGQFDLDDAKLTERIFLEIFSGGGRQELTFFVC